jgi:exopolyphosphatase/guanosine-5'-triphosphate,3'-diphosphate pyrophosphatase
LAAANWQFLILFLVNFGTLKLAAIDIGSNAVRLYIARPLHEDLPDTDFKPVEFTRLPLRLGDDVFKTRLIGKKKVDLLAKALLAFALLIEIYNVDEMRACATSAMRDAENGEKVSKELKKLTGIKVDIISGKEESRLIQGSVLDWLPGKNSFMHIDVGGGSTEIAYIRNGKIKKYESFNIGTVRLKEGKVKQSETGRMKKWLDRLVLPIDEPVKAVGTGGNIVKLLELSGCKSNEALNLKHLQATNAYVKSLSLHDLVYELKLNPDRAEVIGFAGNIYTDIMEACDIHEILAPNIGLKDGIIRELWKKHF